MKKYWWSDDKAQFARFLSELRCSLTNNQINELAINTDLTKEEIEEIFDRADKEFQKLKDKIFNEK